MINIKKIKYIIFLFLSVYCELAHSQVEFYKIGSMWVYEIQPCAASMYYDTIIVEKDTLVAGFNLRKLKYTNIDSSFIFLVTTTGVFRYDKDTLRKIFPLNLKLNDTVLSDLTYATTLLGWGYDYKYFRLKAVCTNVTNTVFGTDTIKNFTIKFDSNSTTNSGVRRAVSVSNAQVLYNNIFGDNINVLFPPPVNLATTACSSMFVKKFTNDKFKYENGSWKLNTFTSVAMGKYSSTIDFNIFPNPTTGETTIKYFIPETEGQSFITITDLNGKQIKLINITTKGESSVVIKDKEFEAGMYFYS